jgi:hypothetical protein
MGKSRKHFVYAALLGNFFLLLVGCNDGGTAPKAEVFLPEVTCQPSDVTANPPFTVAQTHTAVPANTPLSDQIEQYYRVELVENSLAYISVYCDLFVLTDEMAAAELLSLLCPSKMDESEPPDVGEAACAQESTGFRMVNFREGTVVVSIQGDSHGYGVDDWAKMVNGRLLEK